MKTTTIISLSYLAISMLHLSTLYPMLHRTKSKSAEYNIEMLSKSSSFLNDKQSKRTNRLSHTFSFDGLNNLFAGTPQRGSQKIIPPKSYDHHNKDLPVSAKEMERLHKIVADVKNTMKEHNISITVENLSVWVEKKTNGIISIFVTQNIQLFLKK